MIRVQGLRKRFGAFTAIDDVTFDVATGETFALIGPNGAGKTTTLKCLLGLVRPDAGRIAIGPQLLPAHDPQARRALGYVPQRSEFASGRTVRDVLAFFAELRGLPRTAVGEALARVGMQSFEARRADQLSGGYLQRLALAQALLGDPDVLVLDEPTASLDPQATWEFRTLVLELKSQGKTLVLCSHLLAEVERVADAVVILAAGRVVARERMSDLRERQLGATRLHLDLGVDAARAAVLLRARGLACDDAGAGALAVAATDGRQLEALEALREAGIAPRGFEVQRPSLEEVFLAALRHAAGSERA